MRAIGFMLLGVCVALVGCWGDAEPTKPLICHVGGTMRPVIEHLAELYEKETGVVVEITSAGSGELLANIESHREGDLYVCHDPFLRILMEKTKMGVDGWVVAELTPVIVVQKGNPKNIKELKDLTRPDLQVWLTDYKHSTLGRMLKTIFAKAGMDFEKIDDERQFPTHRSGGHAANVVKTGNADAAVVWNAVAALRRDGLDVVPIVPEHLPIPGVDTVTSATGKVYQLMPVRVTIATLTCAAQPEAARKFAHFLVSERGNRIFNEFGFTPGKVTHAYENGKEKKE